ncbi:MAG: hypothetical protein ACJA01_001308 [Saprospiraceae bacterium]|jgi:hypothetical protein
MVALVLSDPICEQAMPKYLKNDDRLRALCLSGALPLQEYLDMITSIGFGTVEVRAKKPYRVMSPAHYETEENIYRKCRDCCF